MGQITPRMGFGDSLLRILERRRAGQYLIERGRSSHSKLESRPEEYFTLYAWRYHATGVISRPMSQPTSQINVSISGGNLVHAGIGMGVSRSYPLRIGLSQIGMVPKLRLKAEKRNGRGSCCIESEHQNSFVEMSLDGGAIVKRIGCTVECCR